MKKLLIVYHTQGVRTGEMAEAVLRGARAVDDVETVMKRAFDATLDDLLSANGIIFGTPENFGYMCGAMKDFLERVFYRRKGKLKACLTPSSSPPATTAQEPSAPSTASCAAFH